MNSPHRFRRPRLRPVSCQALAALTFLTAAWSQEVVLQYFNTSWPEIEGRIPELAEAGYTSLWLPPPCKGASGTYSVGYDVFDRYDLGEKDQMGTVRTRYGTKAELLSLIETAHRFGLRIYLDNVMAHNGGPLDTVPPGTLFPNMPGFVPEDFHLVKRNGRWAKASDSIDYNDEWQVLNRNPFAWDIAQENPNTSFNPTGTEEGHDYAKWTGVRHAGQPGLYLDSDLTVGTDGNGNPVHPFANKEPWQDVGYGAGATGAGNGRFDWQDANSNGQHDAGEAAEPFTDTGVDPSNPSRRTSAWGYGDSRYNMGNVVAEDVNSFLLRSIRWTIDQTNCDGFRLDAVKHVPVYFFGQLSGANRDKSDAGYLGQAQEQFNVTRGYTDWDNHRDTAFDATLARNDLMFFGEHLGAPPNPDDYIAAGMRVANDDFLNNVGGYNGIGSTLQGYDAPGLFTKGVNSGMMYCLSHDNNNMGGSERPAAHQYMLLRGGLPIVYTDGYNIAGGPDYFPKPSYVPFLGQYGQNYVTGPLRVRREFVRGQQAGRWSTRDFAGWEFRDKSENNGMSDADATTLVVLMARNYTSGQGQPGGFTTTLPTNTILRNYSHHGGAFYAYVGNDGKIKELDGAGNFTSNQVVTPSGGYFAFSIPVPERTLAFEGSDSVRPITLQQGGVDCPMMAHPRKDGKNGDPAYAHSVSIPRVTDASDLAIIGRSDGSCVNMLVKLDGGMDVNSQLGIGPTTGTKRDNPPDTLPGDYQGMDLFVGFEQMEFERRMTQKFAAESQSRNVIGSPGAETWEAVIGQSAAFTTNQADPNGVDTDTDTADWLVHDPEAGHGLDATLQFQPPPQSAAGSPITIVAKLGYAASGIGSVKVYYTTDGASYPEGSGNKGRGSTQVANLAKIANGTPDATGTPEWWRGTIPALPAGTRLRYKIGAYKTTAAARYPSTMDNVRKKERMETIFRVTGFNGNTVTYYPHNDKGMQATGLKEGLHVVRTRAFLSRSGQASLCRTNTQTFYLDQQRPQGLVRYPECRAAAPYATIGGSSYGVVVFSDAQTTQVWYNILDSNPANDSATNGNGAGNWVRATAVAVPSSAGGAAYPKEWRFDYKSIPNSGAADMQVRLKELSSSTDNALTDAAGHFTTLVCHVNTGYPVNYGIAFPQNDGDVVNTGYVGKCVFDKSIGSGVPDAQLAGEFSVFLASQESGQPDGQFLLPRTAYAVVRNETPTQDALAFTLPALYNGDPDFLHHVRVVWQRGDISLTDVRLVRAQPGPLADTDADGLPDAWERLVRLDPDNADGDNGGGGDPDRDGNSNLTEYLFNLSPNSPDMVAPLGITLGGDGVPRLTYSLLPSRRYQMEFSGNLQSWQPLGAAVTVPAAATHLWTDPAAAPPQTRRYYRLSVSAQ